MSMTSKLGDFVRRAVGMGPDESDEIETGKRGPAPYPVKDDDDPIKYAVYSKSLMEEQRSAMEPLFITWTQNILFLAGLQWWKYDPFAGGFVLPKVPIWKERPVRNLLLPMFKTFLGKVLKNRPASTSIPASTEPQHLQAAQLGNEVLEAKWFELKNSQLLRRAATWVFTTGNAWILTYWNKDSGLLIPLTAQVQAAKHDATTGEPVLGDPTPMTDEMTGQPMVDPATGQPAMQQGEPVMELIECPCDENGDPILDADGNYDLEAQPAIIDIGEVAHRVYSGFQVFPDPSAETDDDVRFFVIADPMTHREIYQRWPGAKNVVAEDTTQIDRFTHMISVFASGADTHIAASQTKRDQMIPKGLVLHYFEKPKQETPGGRHWVSVGDQLLESPGPLPDGIWPMLTHLGDVEVPGRYHKEATLTAGIGPQREYNELCAQIKEHNNLMQRGKWLVPQGSNIKRGQITNQPGEVIQYTPGSGEPKMADIKPLPNTVFEERDRCLQDLQQVMGMHQSSMGEAAPGVTSGRAFLTLQEADDTDLGPWIEMLENAVAEIGWNELQLIQRYYTEERLLRISGKNNSFRVKSFKGEDLKGVVGVKPQAGSAFPWSASARQSMLIDLGTSFPQLFTDPETGQFDSERFRRMLPLGGMEAVDDSGDLDVAEALREEDIFKAWKGEMDPMTGLPDLPTPQPWQNHQTHLKQHASLLKSAEFFELPQETQDAFVQHWLMTAQLLQRQAAAAVDTDGDGVPDSPAAQGTAGAQTEPPQPGKPAGVVSAGAPPAALDAARADVDRTREAVAGPT